MARGDSTGLQLPRVSEFGQTPEDRQRAIAAFEQHTQGLAEGVRSDTAPRLRLLSAERFEPGTVLAPWADGTGRVFVPTNHIVLLRATSVMTIVLPDPTELPIDDKVVVKNRHTTGGITITYTTIAGGQIDFDDTTTSSGARTCRTFRVAGETWIRDGDA